MTNYPNPFRGITTFSFELNEPAKVTIRIYNNLGRMVDQPVSATRPQGEVKIEWNSGNLPAGIYYYRVAAGNYEGSGKMMKLE